MKLQQEQLNIQQKKYEIELKCHYEAGLDQEAIETNLQMLRKFEMEEQKIIDQRKINQNFLDNYQNKSKEDTVYSNNENHIDSNSNDKYDFGYDNTHHDDQKHYKNKNPYENSYDNKYKNSSIKNDNFDYRKNQNGFTDDFNYNTADQDCFEKFTGTKLPQKNQNLNYDQAKKTDQSNNFSGNYKNYSNNLGLRIPSITEDENENKTSRQVSNRHSGDKLSINEMLIDKKNCDIKEKSLQITPKSGDYSNPIYTKSYDASKEDLNIDDVCQFNMLLNSAGFTNQAWQKSQKEVEKKKALDLCSLNDFTEDEFYRKKTHEDFEGF